MQARLAGKDAMLPTLEINRKIETKKHLATIFGFLFIFLEIAMITGCYFLLYEWRTSSEFNRPMDWLDWGAARFPQYLFFYSIFMIMNLGLMYRYKIYSFRSGSGFADELLKIFKSYGFSILTAIGISFLLKFADFSRLVIVAFWVLALVLSLIIRGLKRLLALRMAAQGILSKNVLIVGAGKIGKSLMDELNNNRWLGYRVIGFVDDGISESYNDNTCLGSTADIKKILYHQHVDDIIITIPSERSLVNRLITDLRKLDIRIKIVPDMFNLVMSTVQIGNINALPVVTLIKTPMHGLGLVVKRLFDLSLALVMMIPLLPVFIITAIAVKIDSSGPVFYKHTRLGKNGKPFSMYKFRSMVQNADQLKDKLTVDNEISGPAFKMKCDPRTTRVGRFIRKFSLDELPQLFNVLKGDMSLVGPRPPLPNEVEQYGDWEWRRLEVLPGITGLWQVSGRSNLSFQQWMSLDIYYIENWNLGLDIKIMFKTIPVVLKGEGAY